MVGSAISPAAPARFARLADSMARSVVYSAMPANTGTRPAAASTAARTTVSFSSGESDEFSPSVPSMTKPSQPAFSDDSRWRAVAGRSSAPSCFISVIKAGITPCQVTVIVGFLSLRD